MASREQLALRRSAALERLNGTLSALSERLGIDTAAVGTASVKDAELAAVVSIEQMADALDAVAGELTGNAKPAAKAAPKKDA
jgi:hypothetical protein